MCKRMGAHQARQQERRLPGRQRRLHHPQHPGRRRPRQVRGRAEAHHHRCLHRRGGQARREPGLGPGRRGAGREHRRLRRGRPQHLPPPEEGPQHGVPARDRPPAPAHQHLRRRHASAPQHGHGHPHLLPRARLLLLPHAAHHRQRLRGCRRDVPRLDPRPREPAPQGGRHHRLGAGLLRQVHRPHRQRTAGGRAGRHLAGQDLHLRSHLPRREQQHPAPPGRVLDD